MYKIPGYNHIQTFADEHGLHKNTVRYQLKAGFCQWPQKLKRNHTKHKAEYGSWRGMFNRCYNPKNNRYPRYGGRGIRVCPEWYLSFLQFYKDMGPRPGPGYSIDRINVDGDYSKDNCRWATAREQNLNTSRTTSLPNIQCRGNTYRAYYCVCGKILNTPATPDVEQAVIDLKQLKLLYQDFA